MHAFLKAHPLATLGLFVPTFLIAFVLLVVPFGAGAVMAFMDASPNEGGWDWVGLENFSDIFDDQTFWEVVRNSLSIVGISIGVGTLAAFGMALLLNEDLKGTRLFRYCDLPGLDRAVDRGGGAVGVAVQFRLRDRQLPARAGRSARQAGELAGQRGAREIVIVSGFVWRIIPFIMITILAALQGISTDLIEAAKIDGAGYATRLRYVVFPLVRNVIVVAALLQGVRLFQEITLPLVVTAGGPINATTTLSLYTYKLAFQQWDFGLAGAVGVVWSVALALAAGLYAWSVERRARGA